MAEYLDKTSGANFTGAEIIFFVNLAADAGNDATQVVLFSEMDITPSGTVIGRRRSHSAGPTGPPVVEP